MTLSGDPLNDPAALHLAAGDLDAIFLPARGMLGASLRHRGEELLRRVDKLAAAAANGSSAGIPLLHPWANRLAGSVYEAAGRKVALDLSSRLLHLDGNRLPMHGVNWALLAWDVCQAKRGRIEARLDWNHPGLLAVFPFPHRLEMTVTLRPRGLIVETTLLAGPDGPVPVSFGFHPYFGIPGLARAQWRLSLPAMRSLVSDERGIPTGVEEPVAAFDSQLGETDFDDGFVVLEERPVFSVAGAGRRVTVELLSGYGYAQVFAPKDKDYIAIEPMTAPTNALASGRGLRLVEPGERFRAAFSITVNSTDSRGRATRRCIRSPAGPATRRFPPAAPASTFMRRRGSQRARGDAARRRRTPEFRRNRSPERRVRPSAR
jgi:aldose 1-epimerase